MFCFHDMLLLTATRDAKVEKQRHETIHLQTQILNSTNCNTGSKSKSTKSGPSGLGSRTAKRSHPSSSSNNCNGNITINPGSNAAKIANNGPASSISGSASELQDRKRYSYVPKLLVPLTNIKSSLSPSMHVETHNIMVTAQQSSSSFFLSFYNFFKQ